MTASEILVENTDISPPSKTPLVLILSVEDMHAVAFFFFFEKRKKKNSLSDTKMLPGCCSGNVSVAAAFDRRQLFKFWLVEDDGLSVSVNISIGSGGD